MKVGKQVLNEANYSQQAASPLTPLTTSKFSLFFLLLVGAGIAEETTFRLVFVSWIWKLTRRKWLAVLISAVFFSAFHLTPLNSMYRINLQFPVSQFVASTLIGLGWGHLFVNRGSETAVLGHTLSDWLPIVLFSG